MNNALDLCHNDYSRLLLPREIHLKNLMGFLDTEPINMCPSLRLSLGNYHFHIISVSTSSNLSKLTFKCSYQLMVPAACTSCKYILAITLWVVLSSPDLRVKVCPMGSVF